MEYLRCRCTQAVQCFIPGKCACMGNTPSCHHQQNSAGWVIFLQLARRAALPARCSMYFLCEYLHSCSKTVEWEEEGGPTHTALCTEQFRNQQRYEKCERCAPVHKRKKFKTHVPALRRNLLLSLRPSSKLLEYHNTTFSLSPSSLCITGR